MKQLKNRLFSKWSYIILLLKQIHPVLKMFWYFYWKTSQKNWLGAWFFAVCFEGPWQTAYSTLSSQTRLDLISGSIRGVADVSQWSEFGAESVQKVHWFLFTHNATTSYRACRRSHPLIPISFQQVIRIPALLLFSKVSQFLSQNKGHKLGHMKITSVKHEWKAERNVKHMSFLNEWMCK